MRHDHIQDVLCEAKCCAGLYANKHAKAANVGEDSPETYWDMMRLNAYIRTLERNEKVVSYHKEKVKLTSTTLSALQKTNSFLSLKNDTVTVCKKSVSDPCLSDEEICHIVEQIRLMCSTCGCNCN